MTTMNSHAIDADTFDAEYVPVDSPSGETMWEFKEVKDYDPNHVWSILDGERGVMYASPGFHIVNNVGYVVTEKPWTDENIVAVWHQPDGDEVTVIRYAYADASNYKGGDGEIVLKGDLTEEQIEEIRSMLEGEEMFVPMEISPQLRHLGLSLSSFPDEDDHVWHVLELDGAEEDFRCEDEITMTVDEFITALRRTSEDWGECIVKWCTALEIH